MYPIALWLLLLPQVVLERAIVLGASWSNPEGFRLVMRRCLLSGDLDAAIRRSREAGTPVGRVVAAGLAAAARPDHEVQMALDEAHPRRMLGRDDLWPGPVTEGV
jgi:hypothetical protein